MADKKSSGKAPPSKTALPSKGEPKSENVWERIVIWLIVAATVGCIWYLLAISNREKPLTCDGSHGGSLTAFGSCK